MSWGSLCGVHQLLDGTAVGLPACPENDCMYSLR